MGAWGFEPWENDLAADWFAELFQKGKIAERVEKALRKQDVEEYWPEIRAAAHVITALGDVWPPDQLAAHHQLAMAQLEAVKHSPDFDGDAAMAAEIDAQIAVLRARVEAFTAVPDPETPGKIPPQYDPAPSLEKLRAPDPQVRLVGLRWLSKHIHSTHRWTDDWLRDPATTEAHLPLLEDPDPEVVEQALINLHGLGSHYHREPRVLPAAARLLKSERPLTRQMAVVLLLELEAGETYLEDLIPLFRDKDLKVRSRVLEELSRAGEWSETANTRLREAARLALEDRSEAVRYYAAQLLGVVGGKAELTAIKKARTLIKGAGWKRDFGELIKEIQQRG